MNWNTVEYFKPSRVILRKPKRKSYKVPWIFCFAPFYELCHIMLFLRADHVTGYVIIQSCLKVFLK